jgi:hypothetical protein
MFVLFRCAVLVLVMVALGPVGLAVGQQRNSCGCYRGETGTCYCDKKAACGCPGDCEPRGCEEARDRALQREIEAETRKAQQPSEPRGPRELSDPGEPGEPRSTAEDGGVKRARTPRAPVRATPETRKLTPGQTRQLAKLLDAYLSARPDARSKTVEDVRKQLDVSP